MANFESVMVALGSLGDPELNNYINLKYLCCSVWMVTSDYTL